MTVSHMIGQHAFHTSEETLNRLFANLDRRGDILKVRRDDLWALLKDHQELATKFTEASNGS